MQKKMSKRTEILQESFNGFINEVVGNQNEEDYYSRLSVNDFVQLKKTLSQINNIITLQVTLAFVEMLHTAGIVNKNQYDKFHQDIENVSANANGYDVCYMGKIGDADGIIAEVKCNIPIENKQVESKQFGAAQITNMKKDVDGLLYGKSKASEIDPKNYLKFLVLLDDGSKVREAAKIFSEKMNKEGKPVTIINNLQLKSLNTDTVYVVICRLE